MNEKHSITTSLCAAFLSRQKYTHAQIAKILDIPSTSSSYLVKRGQRILSNTDVENAAVSAAKTTLGQLLKKWEAAQPDARENADCAGIRARLSAAQAVRLTQYARDKKISEVEAIADLLSHVLNRLPPPKIAGDVDLDEVVE